MVNRIRNLSQEYPNQFWLLMGASLVDMTGGFMLYPFFALYFTERFDIGLTQVGFVFGLFSIGNLLGNALGGALTDRLGRKKMVLFGLVASATTSIIMGLLDDFTALLLVSSVIGIFSNISNPARQSMIADILPEEQHTDGYAIFRIVMNIAAALGPLMGGFIVGRFDFLYLFLADAGTSLLTAIAFAYLLKESRTETAEVAASESMVQTFAGYGVVFRDLLFMALLGFGILVTMVYLQYNTTLPVFLRDEHGVSPQSFSYLLALNALMVVFMQLPITRMLRKLPPMTLMAAGTLFYALGFGMYGVVSGYAMFVLAMVILTIGEMVVSPVWQSLVAKLAPADMRGRYMAVMGLNWIIPFMTAVTLAGVVADNLGPQYIWLIGGGICVVAATGYLTLATRANKRLHTFEEQADAVMPATPAVAVVAAE